MGAGYLHVQFGITDLLTDLFTHAHAAKYRIRCDKRNFSAGRQTGRHTAGILLCNPHIHMLSRKLLRKFYRFAGFSDITIHDIEIRIFFPQFQNLITIRFSCGTSYVFYEH